MGRARDEARAGRGPAESGGGAGIDGLVCLRALIARNGDNLHYTAGSQNIVQLHGNSGQLLCACRAARVDTSPVSLAKLSPQCS